MIKVLMITNDLKLHGISSVIMNYYNAIDSNKIQMDIAAGIPVESNYLDQIKKKNGKLFLLPARKESALAYYKELFRVMKTNRYDIIHVHGNSATISVELFLGMICKVPVRIAHSHNSTCNHIMIHKILSPVFSKLYTHGFACSEIAGKWMFGKKSFEIIENGFDIKKYKYLPEVRDEYRKELGLDNSFVIGHVGFFNEQKNQKFIVSIFKEIIKQRDNAILLLVGDGYKQTEIKKMVIENNLSNQVIFYGESTDVAGIMSAMDCFLFPSLFEGLGIALLEAQISGLPCVVSDVVPDAARICHEYYTLSLSDNSITEWTTKILECTADEDYRKNFIERHECHLSRYDIFSISKRLEELYMSYTS